MLAFELSLSKQGVILTKELIRMSADSLDNGVSFLINVCPKFSKREFIPPSLLSLCKIQAAYRRVEVGYVNSNCA